MNLWLCKRNKFNVENGIDISDIKDNVESGDKIYIYSDDNETGMFLLAYEYSVNNDNKLFINDSFQSKNIDLPYSLLYKTKRENKIIKLSNKEKAYLFDDRKQEAKTTDIKKLFSDYIDNSHLAKNSKKIGTRINYLEKVLPELLNKDKPISIFSITNIEKINEIKDKLSQDKALRDINNSPKYAGQILQTVNLYLDFLKSIEHTKVEDSIENFVENINENTYANFLKICESNLENIELKNITANIQFNIGQPNTGKSYNFEQSRIFENIDSKYYRYLKIPVSGGIGNEYKGLQNTDLAITYDPIKKELRFGEFLQMLMSAIVNPKVPHVVFLDDFHNQDISSLLSEFTPLFKGQQKRDIADINTSHYIYDSEFSDIDEFILKWNDFIKSHCNGIPIVPITNRISGESLKLVYPSNFYLLGAANFNENSLNIFADWEDRAVINYIDPIESFTKEDEDSKFLECCKMLNDELANILNDKKIFDYEKYCFGMWKIVDSKGKILDDLEEQKKLIKFFFGMIKNSLKYNNKNSEINAIGWELMVKMQSNDLFKSLVDLKGKTEIDYEILHKHNIYEDEI